MNGNEYAQDVSKENLERERIATTKSSQFKNLQYSYCRLFYCLQGLLYEIVQYLEGTRNYLTCVLTFNSCFQWSE